MKKNVLVLTTVSGGGGAERLILNQMEYHNPEKFNLHVATLREGNLEEEFQNEAAANNVDYFCLKLNSKLSLPGLRRLRKVVTENDIDLVHTHLIDADMYGFLLKLFAPHIKLISTKHCSDPFRENIVWGALDGLFATAANMVLAVSENVKSFISEHELIPDEKIKVICNGVDTGRFKNRDDVEDLEENLSLTGDFVIGIVASLEERKGHKILFRAVDDLKNDIPDLTLLVVGKGEQRDSLEEYARQLGIREQVKFLGFRDDVEDLYSVMDLLCLPSSYEGLPLVVLEAMSTETLVFASDLPNNEEVIQHDETGILFPRDNHDKLSELILGVYNDPEKYDSVRKNARREILDRYDFKKNLRDLESVYEEVCG